MEKLFDAVQSAVAVAAAAASHLGIEIPQFKDVLCELIDMIRPAESSSFSQMEIKKSGLAKAFFGCLVSPRRLMEFEGGFDTRYASCPRDRQQRQPPLAVSPAWDAFIGSASSGPSTSSSPPSSPATSSFAY
jgi:hypothetical protein